jgi:hypothetical protein
MSSEEDLSPEEKLLKVIQDSPEEGANAPERAPDEPEEAQGSIIVTDAPLDEDAIRRDPDEIITLEDIEPDDAAESVETDEQDRPRLKLADRDDDSEATNKESGPDDDGAQVAALALTEPHLGGPPSALIGDSPSDAAPAATPAGPVGTDSMRNRMANSFNVHRFNRILATCVLILIGLIIYEIVVGLKSSAAASGLHTAGVSFSSDIVSDAELKNIEWYTEPLRLRDPFRAFRVPTGPGPVSPGPDWKKYAKENYEIVAVSLEDDPADSTVFLKDKVIAENTLFRTGDAVTILGDKVRVDEIKRGGVTLTDGVDRLIIN